jgi:uncharacterized protein
MASTVPARPNVISLAGRGAADRLAKLVGRAPDFGELYGMLSRAGRNVELSTVLLRELMRAWPDGMEKRVELVELEHENDAVTHDIVHHLHSRLAVPFERSDVLALASGLDDVVDYAEEAADFLGLYRVEAPMDQAIALTDALAAAGHELAAALASLEDLPAAQPHLREVKRLENEGDRLLREGLTALFEGGVDPMMVIRWKDIFERVEDGIDAVVSERDEPLVGGVDVGRGVEAKGEADLRSAGRRPPVRVERPHRLLRVPGDAQPTRQRRLDVRLPVSVLGNVEAELPVERQGPPHVLHDEADEVQSSLHHCISPLVGGFDQESEGRPRCLERFRRSKGQR